MTDCEKARQSSALGCLRGEGEDALAGETDHGLAVAPEGDVVLEGEHVEEQVEGRDEEGHRQQPQIRVYEDPLHLQFIKVTAQ